MDTAAKEQQILDALKKTVSVEAMTDNKVVVTDGKVLYNGYEVHNIIATKILEYGKQGFPVEHMIKFLDNLLKNPSKVSIDTLYPFLEKIGLPITDDGCFLGYKGVNNDYTSKTRCKKTGKVVVNVPGSVVEMPRSEVEDRPSVGCAAGLHVGDLSYAKSFGEKVVVVKVNPADCVSVPTNECMKLRTCRYEVVRDLNETELVGVYDKDGNSIKPQVYRGTWAELEDELSDDFDDDYGDDYDDDDYDGNYDDDYDQEDDGLGFARR